MNCILQCGNGSQCPLWHHHGLIFISAPCINSWSFAGRPRCSSCTAGAAGAPEWSTVHSVCSGLRAHAYMHTHYGRQKYLWLGLKLWTKSLAEPHRTAHPNKTERSLSQAKKRNVHAAGLFVIFNTKMIFQPSSCVTRWKESDQDGVVFIQDWKFSVLIFATIAFWSPRTYVQVQHYISLNNSVRQ